MKIDFRLQPHELVHTQDISNLHKNLNGILANSYYIKQTNKAIQRYLSQRKWNSKQYEGDMVKNEYRVLSKRSFESQLVKRQTFATRLLNSCPSLLSEPQSSYLHTRDFLHPNVISNSPNNHGNLILLLVLALVNKTSIK